jgi:uncharacterized membrane protein YdjX (TVP38/TMEM64 family)
LIATLPCLSVLSAVGTALAPGLLPTHPLLLVALAPRWPFLVVAARHSGPVAFALVGFARLTLADGPSFLLARHHGPRLHALASRSRVTGALDRIVTRLFDRFGLALVACSPTGRVLAAAGLSDLPGRRVARADAVGTVVQLAVVYAIGRDPLAALAVIAIALVLVSAVLIATALVGAKVSRGSLPRRPSLPRATGHRVLLEPCECL